MWERTPLPDLRHLRCFVVVADMLSISAAALRLGLAQPAVTQQIQRLEARVGSALLLRSKSGATRVKLTEAGKTLLPLARRQLLLACNALDAVQAGGGDFPLRIGFVSSCAPTVLSVLLNAYRAEFQATRLQLVEMTTAMQADAMLEGKLDICIGRDVAADDELFDSLLLQREDIQVVMNARHPLAQESTGATAAAAHRIDAGALRDDAFVLFPRARGEAFYDRIVAPCTRAGFSPRVVQEAQQWLTLAGLVAAGMGVTLMPSRIAALVGSSCAVAGLTDPQADTALHLYWERGGLTTAASQLCEVARRLFGPQQPDA